MDGTFCISNLTIEISNWIASPFCGLQVSNLRCRIRSNFEISPSYSSSSATATSAVFPKSEYRFTFPSAAVDRVGNSQVPPLH